jgi:phosphoheptose isomerase
LLASLSFAQATGSAQISVTVLAQGAFYVTIGQPIRNSQHRNKRRTCTPMPGGFAMRYCTNVACSDLDNGGVELEALVDEDTLHHEDELLAYPFAIPRLPYIEPLAMWSALLGNLILQTPAPVMAARFHKGLAKVIVQMIDKLSRYECGAEMGNGGSSCDAAHMAVEFQHPVTAGRPALPALNLVSDTAMITAVGNNVGFAHIFVRQLIAQSRRGDALIGVSTSGNSDNLLAAFVKAKELGLLTIGLAGGSGE